MATLAAAEELVLGLDHDERRLARPADRLAVVDACVRLAAVVESLLVEVVGEAERADAARIAVGCWVEQLLRWPGDASGYANEREPAACLNLNPPAW